MPIQTQATMFLRIAVAEDHKHGGHGRAQDQQCPAERHVLAEQQRADYPMAMTGMKVSIRKVMPALRRLWDSGSLLINVSWTLPIRRVWLLTVHQTDPRWGTRPSRGVRKPDPH